MASLRYKLMRYKFIDLPVGQTKISLYEHKDGQSTKICEKTVEVLKVSEGCSPDGYKYLKYLSPDGRYKFIPFERVCTLSQEDEDLGSVQKMVTSLSTASGLSYNIGKKTNKKIVLTTKCTFRQYIEWCGVFQSPRVYLQKDNSDLIDEEGNWLLVSTEGSSEYSTKQPRHTFQVTVTLPEYNNITM